MEVQRSTEIEQELSRLGWTHPKSAPEVHVYREYRPNKKINQHLPWEYTVYYRSPAWKWDLVIPISPYTNSKTGEKYGWRFNDWNPVPGQEWFGNNRWDFETDQTDPVIIARLLNEEFEDVMDNDPKMGPELLHDVLFMHRFPVQRVTNRPTKEDLNG